MVQFDTDGTDLDCTAAEATCMNNSSSGDGCVTLHEFLEFFRGQLGGCPWCLSEHAQCSGVVGVSHEIFEKALLMFKDVLDLQDPAQPIA